MTALAELLRNPEPGDNPIRHIDLAAFGYLLLDAPHPERPEGGAP